MPCRAPHERVQTAVCQLEPMSAVSISFIVTTENAANRCETILDILKSAKTDIDEVVVVTSMSGANDSSLLERSWFKVIGIPGASVFTLRARVPAIARNDWVVVLEEHSIVTSATIDAARRLIRDKGNIDLVVFLGKNLTSTGSWGWANFLHTFAFAWAPIRLPPTFSPVTAVAVRRSAFNTDGPLRDGEWELSLIPRLFATGRTAYSNEIFIDHIRHFSLTSGLAIAFHNARAGSGLSRNFGRARRAIFDEGWYAFTQRPAQIVKHHADRWHELPAGVLWRLYAVGLAHLIGNAWGAFLGPGKSPHKLD